MNKKESKAIIPVESIERTIYVIRDHKVILDQDLAILYGVPTKRLNEQVRRNINRFPEDFSFQLTKGEWDFLRCQIGTSNENILKSQIATSSWGGRRKLPFVFTEHGALMAANILRSKRAISVSIEIVRAFIRLRQALASHEVLTKELQEIKEFVLKNSNKNNREFQHIWKAIEKLTDKPKEQQKIGFNLG
ncbi:ORF6N domain-containing protein [Patescibacteria group bacterium]|nr:ORF6N domain-containing protein [Patescibacteria group bacterium]MBU1683286.1 ORF6N domain-containing protein [Patescibacteria group bacterium]MBU1934690.1 ORF6N domain-containing protein [Patescibacteria group bacterium]